MLFNKNNPPPGFYVYAYIRANSSDKATEGTPYYIGKGMKDRAWGKHRFRIPSNPTYIVIIESNLTELGALALERRLIRWYGRKDIGTGILRNLTDGGEGVTGYKPSEELKQYWSNIRKGNGNGMFGRKHSEEIRVASSIRRSKTNSIRRWYNNGTENIFSPIDPGPEWVRGRINQKPSTAGNKWYNNGIIAVSKKEKPAGEEWVSGMLPKKQKNLLLL